MCCLFTMYQSDSDTKDSKRKNNVFHIFLISVIYPFVCEDFKDKQK
jgi:hypothetical protein